MKVIIALFLLLSLNLFSSNAENTISNVNTEYKNACDYARSSKSKAVWEMYLKKFPKGSCAFEAEVEMGKLKDVSDEGEQEPAHIGCTDGKGCFKLGYNYEKGVGVSKDINKANKLYKKSCDLGIKKACKVIK